MPQISVLPVASAVNPGDLFVIVQSGITKQATDSVVIASLNLGTLALVNSPCPPANGGTGVASPTVHTLPIAEGASNFNFVGPLTNGQLLIGSTGSDPVAANITGGAGITISNNAGSITISSSGSGVFGWTTVTGTTQLMASNNGYITNNAGTVTLTLPTTSSVGDEIDVIGMGAGGWLIAQNASQTIHVGSVASTVGAGGSVASTNQYDSLTLICVVANTTWTLLGAPQSAGLTII